ncbi:MAG: DUF4488 domain-containing protein [Bacteroidaceae bacterium]|nr:DUF4488 domain-containing protein [Bacteroidaceae bacterium]
MKRIGMILAVAALLFPFTLQAQTPEQPQQQQNQPQQSQQGRHRRQMAAQGQPDALPVHFRLVGVWQQVNVVTDSAGVETEVFLPVWKVLQGDGHFTNFVMAFHKAPSFITQEGDFRVVSDKYYSERTRRSVVAPELQGVEVMMEYTLDEEKGEMRLRFMMPNSERPQTEVWRRVRLEVPSQLREQP